MTTVTFARYAVLEEGRWARKTAAWVTDGERICGITVWKTDPDHTTGGVGSRRSPQSLVYLDTLCPDPLPDLSKP